MTSPDPAWDVGEPYRFPLEYRDPAGVLVDPTTIVATVKLPDATIADLSTSVARGTTGRAVATWTALVDGRHIFRFVATGPGAKVDELTLYARAPFTPAGGTPTADLTTPTGMVRLLTADTDPAASIFTDAEYLAFLTFEGGNVRLAAAQALDVIASNEVLIAKVIRSKDLSTDGAKVSAELRARATGLRQQNADQDFVDDGGMIIVDYDVTRDYYGELAGRGYDLGVF